MKLKQVILIVFLTGFLAPCFGQNSKLEQLENRRKELNREINQLNKFLFQGRKEQRSIISVVEDLNYKITVRKNLISITNQQANLLTREINNNQKQISKLRDRLKVLKEEYAAMVVKSYKSKSEQSRVMFLLSSSNFQQAYKRLQYIKQYAEYQKKQGEEIKVQTANLQQLNIKLSEQKKDKQALIQENRKVKNELEKELNEQESLEISINKELNKYTAQIKAKQRQVDELDREIERIIKAAMAASNKKAGKSSNAKTFSLTPEDKALAASFTSNKGKLPWPVEQGVVRLRFGTQPHPVVRTATIKSNGVRIATNTNQKVRAVFKGKVHSIIISKNGSQTVLIQHGNYFTVYRNLSKIYVKKGVAVDTKQEIGEVLTNKTNGQTLLNFAVWKDGKPQNPSHWVYKM